MKANLKQKVLCSLLAASAFGFAYSDSVHAAQVNGNELGKVVTNDNLINVGKSGKFVIGQGDIVIQTNASVGTIMADYNKYIKDGKSQLEAIRLALGPTEKNGVIVGVVGGEGQFDQGLKNTLWLVGNIGKMAGLSDSQINLAKKLQNINTLDEKTANQIIDKNINIIVGGTDEKGNLTQPVVLGLVGGDLSVNANLTGEIKLNEVVTPITSSETTITRNGDVNMVIDSGNIFGAVGGSAAVGIGNIAASAIKETTIGPSKMQVNVSIDTAGNTKTTLNGDVKIGVNNGANVAGMAAGGGAFGIGGKAVSDVTGDTTLIIDSKVDGSKLEGLTVGVAGGGVAVSTIGGTAHTTVGGNTNISINNGLAAGVIGGGLAASVDAAGLLNVGNDNGTSDTTISGIDVVINNAIQGGEATSTVEGNTNIALTGTTSAAGVIGGGIAMSSHTYTNRDNTDNNVENNGQPGGASVAKAETGKTNIYIDLNDSELDKGKLVNAAKELKNNIGNITDLDSAKLINALQKSAEDLKEQGAAIGVIGGGVAVAHGDANSSATAENAGAQIDLVNGYVVGTLGGGMAAATNNAEATATTTDDIVVNVHKDAEAIAVFGNGAAYFTGSSNGGTKNLDGMAQVNAANTTINIAGSADGVVGGGLAIDDSQSDKTNASVKTSGTSTINVLEGAVVDKMNFQPLTALAGEANKNGIDMGNYVAGVAEAAGNVAIAGGGVAVGGGAESVVAESVINVAGGEVEGDVIGGGVAAYGYAGEGGTTVEKSTMNLTGGKIDGSVYAGGAISANDAANKGYTAAKSTVKEAVINLAGTEVTGEISGQGYKHVANDNNIVENSTLNVMGNNTLAALNDKSKINGFNNVNFQAGSVTTVTGLKAGNTNALIDGNGNTITVANGAKLDISQLTKTADAAYYIAGNYKEGSTLWDNADLAYDRTEGYATSVEDEDGYKVTYKELGALSEKEQAAAVDSWTDSLGEKGKNIRGIIEGMVTDMDATNAGAKEFFSNSDIPDPDLTVALMLGEASGVTSNAVSIAGDMADNAVLRLSFTQDKVTGETTVAEDGGVWAKYIHNKHDVDNMASSMGGLTSTSKYDGIMVGAEFAKKGKVQSGVAFTYGDGDAHGMGTKNDFDMWGINVYGNVKNADSNVIADIGFAKNTNDITGSALGKDLSADRDLNILTMGVRAEKLYTNGNTQIVPYAGLRYMNVDADSYTTYYNGKAAFENDADRQNIWTLPIGVSLRNETVTASGWRFTPRADVSYIWAFGDTDNDMTVNAGSGYDTLSYTVMDSGSWLGALALEAAKDDWSYGVGYSYQKGSHAENNKWFVNVNYSF